jgi:hypothetical protein
METNQNEKQGKILEMIEGKINRSKLNKEQKKRSNGYSGFNTQFDNCNFFRIHSKNFHYVAFSGLWNFHVQHFKFPR